MADEQEDHDGKGPDNNKRLAALEALGPQLMLAVGAVAGRFAPALELAPLDANEDGFGYSLRVLGYLDDPMVVPHPIAELADLLEARDSFSRVGKEAPLEATARHFAELDEQVKSLKEDLAVANRARAAADRAARSGQSVKDRSAKARKYGGGTATKPFETDYDALEALMADPDAGPFELVFSNGATEIIELHPIEVYAPAFRRIGKRAYQLNDPVVVRGARDGTRIRGFALVHDGKQVAYMKQPDAVQLDAGMERKFVLSF